MLLYNIPPRTGANPRAGYSAPPRRVAGHHWGLAELSGNIAQITELLTTAPRSFKVFAGDDVLALPILALGGAGLISVASNAHSSSDDADGSSGA